ncbi:MAG TPA: pitrilysin family protein [Acidobacteriota bacterium]|nr:pitrilysin family protein [Acidobacteriota bacterium]
MNSYERVLCFAAVLLACIPVLFAAIADVKPPPLKIESQTLNNGMKVVMAEDHSRPVINLQVWYHVGSKDERLGRTGFAHLFEHLMFRGSKNVGPEEHMRYVREAGGEVNAYTSFDQTVYWETFPSNYLERMTWLEADRMESLNISQENFTKEREVVKEERRLRYENSPYGLLAEDVLNATYKIYPYKHLPIGSMEDLNKATTADVQEFFNTFYVPNNATLVLVGDFEPSQALAFAKRHFGRIPHSKKPVPRVTVTEPQQTGLAEIRKSYSNVPLPAMASAYHLPPAGSPDSYALEIASEILSSGQSSRLYRRLVYDEQVAVEASGNAFFLEGPSVFFAFGIVNQGKDVKQVSASLHDVLESIKKTPVSDQELTKAKNQVIAQYVIGRQSAQSKADALGKAAVLHGNPELYNTELAHYQKVTAADVQRVAQKYLTESNETRMWVSPAAAK